MGLHISLLRRGSTRHYGHGRHTLALKPQASICLGLSHALVAAQATGSPTDLPKTKEAYVNWGDMDLKLNLNIILNLSLGMEGAITNSGLGLPYARVAAQATGSPTDFPKTKEAYVNWGDMDDDGDSSSRFKGPLEPFTKPLVEQK